MTRFLAALLVVTRAGVKAKVDPDTPGAGEDGPVRLAEAHHRGRALRAVHDGLMAALAEAVHEEPAVTALKASGREAWQQRGGTS